MSKDFTLYRNTKDRTEFEMECDVMECMTDDAETIDWEEFSEHVDVGTLETDLGYDPNDGNDISLATDWTVTYQKSKYGGLVCYILCHTECNFIFLKAEDAKMLQESFAQNISPLEWQRRTSLAGSKRVDPR